MVRSPEERENTLRRSLSQSDGDSYKMADGMDPNAEVQQRAMQRYHKLLQTDKQLQVCFSVTNVPCPCEPVYGVPCVHRC
jgi:hypothetical protein